MRDALQRDLEARLEGEVRFDKISRALYSTDASVYEIEPLGVVIVRSRDDILGAITCARRHACSITARGGGTSQAGQAIGEGLQLDTSKYFNRLLEVNVDERWARVEPGIVLDELNAQLAPHGLRFAPDISTASRATIGGMISNNSSGARSVLYGKTIDHVLDLHLALADGTGGPPEAARRRSARRRDARPIPWRVSATGPSDAWAPSSPPRSTVAIRRSSVALAGTTSMRLSIPPNAVATSPSWSSGRRARSASWSRLGSTWCRCRPPRRC